MSEAEPPTTDADAQTVPLTTDQLTGLAKPLWHNDPEAFEALAAHFNARDDVSHTLVINPFEGFETANDQKEPVWDENTAKRVWVVAEELTGSLSAAVMEVVQHTDLEVTVNEKPENGDVEIALQP